MHAGELQAGLQQQLFDTPGDGLPAIAREAAHLQLRQSVDGIGRQALQVVAQAVGQRMRAFVAADDQLVPAAQLHLIDAQHQILPRCGIAQRVAVRAILGHLQQGALIERIEADVDQQQHRARLRGGEQRLCLNRRQGQRQCLA
ncbi:hypothetical protein D3C77_595110 [compost metagenome]